MKNRSLILLLATFTLIVFPIAGFMLAWWIDGEKPVEVLEFHESVLTNIVAGLLIGTATGVIAWFVIGMRFLAPVRQKYGGLIASLNLKLHHIVFISICAGVGEEILFRGGIQPFLGIWITSVVFVALHGYLNPMDWRVSIYGVVMTLIIALYGYMNNELGILSSIVAHAAIDVYLLIKLTGKPTINTIVFPEDLSNSGSGSE